MVLVTNKTELKKVQTAALIIKNKHKLPQYFGIQRIQAQSLTYNRKNKTDTLFAEHDNRFFTFSLKQWMYSSSYFLKEKQKKIFFIGAPIFLQKLALKNYEVINNSISELFKPGFITNFWWTKRCGLKTLKSKISNKSFDWTNSNSVPFDKIQNAPNFFILLNQRSTNVFVRELFNTQITNYVAFENIEQKSLMPFPLYIDVINHPEALTFLPQSPEQQTLPIFFSGGVPEIEKTLLRYLHGIRYNMFFCKSRRFSSFEKRYFLIKKKKFLPVGLFYSSSNTRKVFFNKKINAFVNARKQVLCQTRLSAKNVVLWNQKSKKKKLYNSVSTNYFKIPAAQNFNKFGSFDFDWRFIIPSKQWQAFNIKPNKYLLSVLNKKIVFLKHISYALKTKNLFEKQTNLLYLIRKQYKQLLATKLRRKRLFFGSGWAFYDFIVSKHLKQPANLFVLSSIVSEKKRKHLFFKKIKNFYPTYAVMWQLNKRWLLEKQYAVLKFHKQRIGNKTAVISNWWIDSKLFPITGFKNRYATIIKMSKNI